MLATKFIRIWVFPGPNVPEKRFDLEIRGPCKTVKDLKEELSEVGGLYRHTPDCVPVSKMRIVFQGQHLTDEEELLSYGIQRRPWNPPGTPAVMLVIQARPMFVRRAPRAVPY